MVLQVEEAKKRARAMVDGSQTGNLPNLAGALSTELQRLSALAERSKDRLTADDHRFIGLIEAVKGSGERFFVRLQRERNPKPGGELAKLAEAFVADTRAIAEFTVSM